MIIADRNRSGVEGPPQADRSGEPGSRARRLSSDESELQKFVAPAKSLFAPILAHPRYLVAFLVAIYALSGVSIIRSNEIGMIVRLGALVGETQGQQVHGPGLLFALPPPFDETRRVNTGAVRTIEITELHVPKDAQCDDGALCQTDLLLTGDRNLLSLSILARFTIVDPVGFTFGHNDTQASLRSAIAEAVVRNAASIELDQLLAQGRSQFVSDTTRDAQSRLNQIDAGIQIINLEFLSMDPPGEVADDFAAVQSAFITAQTAEREAEKYAARIIPDAQAEADEMVADARAFGIRTVAVAKAESRAFEDLLTTFRASPTTVKERLYREGLERSFANQPTLVFVPEPLRSRYDGMRLSFGSSTFEERPQHSRETDPPQQPKGVAVGGSD